MGASRVELLESREEIQESMWYFDVLLVQVLDKGELQSCVEHQHYKCV